MITKNILYRISIALVVSAIAFCSLIPQYFPIHEQYLHIEHVYTAPQRTKPNQIAVMTPTPIQPIMTTVVPTVVPTQEVLAATLTPTPIRVVYSGEVGALYSLENSYRTSQGLPALIIDSRLQSSASAKAIDMVRNNYFSHVSPSGISWTAFVLNAGYNYALTGENLAVGYTTANAIFNGWVNSSEHRANLLNPNFQNIGIAIVCGVSLIGYTNTCVTVMHLGKLQ